MGVVASLVSCVRVAMSAFSFGLGACYLLTDVLTFILKAVVLVATCYVLLMMMEGKVDIHVESNGVHFSPLKFVRNKIMSKIYPVKPGDKKSPLVSDPSSPPSSKKEKRRSSTKNEEKHEKMEVVYPPSQPPEESRSLLRVFRTVFDYFVPGH